MNLSSFVNKNMVTVNLRANTKRAVIAEIVGYICSRLALPDKNQILQSILDREEKASTGIGDGVAIPHCRLPHLERVLFFVGISKPGIDFGAPDGKAAHIIFLFVTPEVESQTHLKILSAIGNLQQNGALLEKLTAAKTDSELFDILNYEQVQRESYYPLTREEVFRELETSEAGLSDYDAR
ncbi:MAG TPA: PTS sugar transporter subunit IIA, partial [Spirochaetia bacterium]|nr:PTS sugar transporter subunit IIA [Spirochaetia bacterium]